MAGKKNKKSFEEKLKNFDIYQELIRLYEDEDSSPNVRFKTLELLAKLELEWNKLGSDDEDTGPNLKSIPTDKIKRLLG